MGQKKAAAAAVKGVAAGTRGGVQKKKAARGRRARSVTQQEFGDVMAHFVAEADKRIAAHLRTHPRSPLADGALWSFDNPSWHDGDLSHLGIVEGVDRVPLPPASGDMHKVRGCLMVRGVVGTGASQPCLGLALSTPPRALPRTSAASPHAHQHPHPPLYPLPAPHPTR